MAEDSPRSVPARRPFEDFAGATAAALALDETAALMGADAVGAVARAAGGSICAAGAVGATGVAAPDPRRLGGPASVAAALDDVEAGDPEADGAAGSASVAVSEAAADGSEDGDVATTEAADGEVVKLWTDANVCLVVACTLGACTLAV
jgi:hypothetical protein